MKNAISYLKYSDFTDLYLFVNTSIISLFCRLLSKKVTLVTIKTCQAINTWEKTIERGKEVFR